MKNVTHTIKPWFNEKTVTETEVQPERISLDLSEDSASLDKVLENVCNKYKQSQQKNVYDAIIAIESAIRSLNR